MKKAILIFTISCLLIGGFSFVEKIEGAMEKDITPKMPGATFLQPQEGNVLTGEVKIAVQVSGISSIEFYLR